MYTLERRDASFVTPTHPVVTSNSNNSQDVCVNRQNGSHSVHNTLNSRLPSFQSFTNFHNRRSSRNRSSSSTYRSKILKRCGRQLKRLIGRKVAVEHIPENDGNSLLSINSYQTTTTITANTNPSDSSTCLLQCKERCISAEILKDVQNQQSRLSEEVNQLKQQFLEIQTVLVSIQNILMNRIHLNCLHTTSSIPPYPLNPSISSSNKNNSNIPTFSPIISVVNSNMLSTNDEMDSSLNNVHKYYDNTAFIHNPCMKSDSVVYLTTCSSQSLPTATPIHVSEISKPPAIHTSFMPLEILTNHSSENTVITPSISSSPSILSAVCDSILSHIPLSVVNKTSLDHANNSIASLQTTPNLITSANSTNQTQYMPLNEQINMLSSFTSTQSSQPAPYTPIVILNSLHPNYPQTTYSLTIPPSSFSTETATSNIVMSYNNSLPKLKNSHECRDSDEKDNECTSLNPSTVTNGIDENIDPLENSPTSTDSSQQHLTDSVGPLNTFEIAATVRDLLTRYNISQRQFSRHVLKVSHGTVNELLSKPRPWYRLTARGRDSYRRLHAWISDPNNVNTFKTVQSKQSEITQPVHEVSSSVKQSLPVPVSDPVELSAPCQWELPSTKISSLSSFIQPSNNLEGQNVISSHSHGTECTYNLDKNQTSNSNHQHYQSCIEVNTNSRSLLKFSEPNRSDESVLLKEEQETERRVNQILLAAKVAMDHEKQIKTSGLTEKATNESVNTAIKPLSSISSDCQVGVCSPPTSIVTVCDLQTSTSGGVINSLVSTSDSSLMNGKIKDTFVSSCHLSTFSNNLLRSTRLVESNPPLDSSNNNLCGNINMISCIPPTALTLQNIDLNSTYPSLNTVTSYDKSPSSQIGSSSVCPNTIVHPSDPSMPNISTGTTVSDLLRLFAAQINNHSINVDKSIKSDPGITNQNYPPISETQSILTSVIGGHIGDSKLLGNNQNILFNSNIPLLANLSSSLSSDCNNNTVNNFTSIYTGANEFATSILPSSVIRLNQPPIPPLGISPPSIFPQTSSSSASLQQTLMLLASAATGGGVPLQPAYALGNSEGNNENHFNYSDLSAKTSSNSGTVNHNTYEMDENLSDSNYCHNLSSFQRIVLPPLKQEDIDRYSELSTEVVTQRTRSMLSQYSISQKLFGAHVLGLSQGSVSDLLTRPKPWKSLTQKGREPFIRMQSFLDNPDSVIKLLQSSAVSSQLSATQKAFLSTTLCIPESTGNSTNSAYIRSNTNIPPEFMMDQDRFTCQTDLISSRDNNNSMPVLTTFKVMDKSEMSKSFPLGTFQSENIQSNQTELEVNTDMHTQQYHYRQQQQQRCIDQTMMTPTTPTFSLYDSQSYCGQTVNCSVFEPITSPSGSPTPNSIVQNEYGSENENTFSLGSSSYTNNHNDDNITQNSNFYQRPSSKKVIELATSITDLDTTSMCSRIKELLQRHSIPQRLFGDVVLGMCQASVSDILSKTRPWSQLSNKARIPYVRLHLWLQEPHHLEMLKAAQINVKSATRPNNNNNNSKVIDGFPTNSLNETFSCNNNVLSSQTSDSFNGQVSSTKLDPQLLLGVSPDIDSRSQPQLSSSSSLLSMKVTTTSAVINTTTITTTTTTTTTTATPAAASSTRKRVPSLSLNQESCINSPNSSNKNCKLLKIDSSQLILPSPNNKSKQTTHSSQAPIDELNEYERQSLFDIAKAATAAMLLASNSNKIKPKVPISPVRNIKRNSTNMKYSKVITPNSKFIDTSKRNLHQGISASQKKVLISACRNQLNLSSTEIMKSLAQDLSLPYKTVYNWIHDYQTSDRAKSRMETESDSDVERVSDHSIEASNNDKSSANFTSDEKTITIQPSSNRSIHKQTQNRRKPVNPTRLAACAVVNSPNNSLHDSLTNKKEHGSPVVPVT